jgi:hypothetical protein
MNPAESKIYLRVLSMVAILWLLAGYLILWNQPDSRAAFIQIYLVTLLDLAFLTVLFWVLFFPPESKLLRQILAMVFLTFKLVCLGFLAITLKRLRNVSIFAEVYGVCFMGMGPLISAVIYRVLRKTQQR